MLDIAEIQSSDDRSDIPYHRLPQYLIPYDMNGLCLYDQHSSWDLAGDGWNYLTAWPKEKEERLKNQRRKRGKKRSSCNELQPERCETLRQGEWNLFCSISFLFPGPSFSLLSCHVASILWSKGASIFARTPCLHREKALFPWFPFKASSPKSYYDSNSESGPEFVSGGLRRRFPQGKVAELRQELNSGGKKDKNHSAKKIALKKIVANMTMSNNDMINLFPDIIGCMQIGSLEIKKMWESQRRVCISDWPIGAFYSWSTIHGQSQNLHLKHCRFWSR